VFDERDRDDGRVRDVFEGWVFDVWVRDVARVMILSIGVLRFC